MRKSSLDRLREAKAAKHKPVELDLDGLLKLLVDPTHEAGERSMNPTQEAFIKDDTRIVGYMGPAGCAKTSTLCAMGFARALLQPGSKGLIARAHYNNLKDTTALRMEEMLRALPRGVLLDRDKTPPMKWWIQPIPQKMPDGSVEETPSQITFMGLTDGLGSYEFDWAILDEADQIDEKVIHEVNSRLRYRPEFFTKQGLSVPYKLGMAFNPPDKHHFLYTACTGKDYRERFQQDPWVKLFRPQAKENIRNLDKDYYNNLTASLPEDMRQRLVDGEWGSTFEGQPVYREFKFAMHARSPLPWDRESPIIRGWDFGYRRPACVWMQLDDHGRLLVLREFLGENIEARPFAERVKQLSQHHFPGHTHYVDYGDPAAVQKKDTGQTLNELHKSGIKLFYQTSTIERGLQILRLRLEQLIEGEPAIQVDRLHCPITTAMLRGGYRMDDHGLKPVKDGFYDHIADALRYALFNLFNGSMPAMASKRAQVSQWLPDSIEYQPNNDIN